jgi:hypothetical protein
MANSNLRRRVYRGSLRAPNGRLRSAGSPETGVPSPTVDSVAAEVVRRFSPGPFPLLDEGTLRTAVGALGIFHLVLGLYMFFFPASFYFRIGTYGPENTHYVGDVSTFVLAIGVALLLAVGRPSWRAPVLGVAALWYGFHALNHLIDIGEARSTARGVIDFLLLAVGCGLLAWLAVVADRTRRFGAGERAGTVAPEEEPVTPPPGGTDPRFEDHSRW